MDSTTKDKKVLLSQGSRTLRDRHEGIIVPDSLGSSSNDGPTDVCTARASAEDAIATKRTAEEGTGSSGFTRPSSASSKTKMKGGGGSRRSSLGERSMDSQMEGVEVNETITLISREEGDYEKATIESYVSGGGTLRKRKRGRPPSTGEHSGLAETKMKLADVEEREMRLQQERVMMALTTKELYKKSNLNMDAIEEARQNSSVDLASKARELQRRVLHVAKASKKWSLCRGSQAGCSGYVGLRRGSEN